MAYTRIHPIKRTLQKALDYIENPDKTDDQMLVSAYNVDPLSASFEFSVTAAMAKEIRGDYTQTGGGNNLAYHLIQSFSPEDKLTPELAHEIGKKMADQLLSGKYEYVISTHVDKDHIHNHIIFNSVSFVDFHKYETVPYKTVAEIRRVSDRLCEEYGLSVIREPDLSHKSMTHYEWEQTKKGTSWRAKIRAKIDEAVAASASYEEFTDALQRAGVEIKEGKRISFRLAGTDQERFIRGDRIGEEYSREGILRRIEGSGQPREKENPKPTGPAAWIEQAVDDTLTVPKDREPADEAPDLPDPELTADKETPSAKEKRRTKYNWWTPEYKEARQVLYGTKDMKADPQRAFALMMAEAERQNGFAIYDIGKMYLVGNGCEKNRELADQWFSRAKEAFVNKRMTAKHPDYLDYRIGKMYASGYGAEQDYSEAAEWYKKAASAKNSFAEYALGSLYSRGQGVDKNATMAYQYFLRAASNEKKPNVYAAYELGRIYADGIGTAQDVKASEEWYRKAYAGFIEIESKGLQDDNLYYRLGRMNLNGTGTEVDLKKAEAYLQKAERLGNLNAKYGLGRLYLTQGFENFNSLKAEQLLLDAAEKGHDYAQYFLGKLYAEGTVLQGDEEKAVHWLEKAAEQDNAAAEYLLGRLYLFGSDSIFDVDKGIAYLSASQEHGNTYAGKLLDSRKVTVARIHELGNALRTVRRESIRSEDDFASRLDQLKLRSAEVRESVRTLQQKNRQYVQVLKYLKAWHEYLPLYHEKEQLRGTKKKRFEQLHAGELNLFAHADNELEKLGIHTSVDPEKLMGLIRDQEARTASLGADLKRVEDRIAQLRKAEELVRKLHGEETEQEEPKRKRSLERGGER